MGVAIDKHVGELVKFRSLIWALVTRYLSVRYRGSALGFLWTLLNPLALMLTYWLVFAVYIRFSGVDNYAVFLFCGLLPWIWFSSALIEGTISIQTSGHLITKSMFPAHILPLVTNISSLINFVLSLPLLLVFLLGCGIGVSFTILLLPFLIIANFVFIQGLLLLFSSLNVLFRDVQHLVASALTFLFFLCPILYPIEMVPERFRPAVEYNPLSAFTLLYQDILFEQVPGSPVHWFLVFVASIIVYTIGFWVFDRHRETFAELL